MSDAPKQQPPPDPPKAVAKPRLVATNPKVNNKGVDPALLRFLNDPHWRQQNILVKQFQRLDYRLTQCIDGLIPFFLVAGPPGIHKSGKIDRRLSRYSEAERAKWEATPPEHRPDRRNMEIEATGEVVFRPMYFRVTGRISHPQMHCRMYWSSFKREIFFMDDVSSLRNKQVQEILQMASDDSAETGRIVSYNFHQKNLPDDMVPLKYKMRGCIIAVCNFDRKTEAVEMKELFTKPVLDRATELHFSFEPMPLLQYVTNLAFVRQKGGPKEQTSGLLKYVYSEPSVHEEADEGGGIGYKGEVDDAVKMLMEVRDFFLVNHERALISFRTLRKITRDRFTTPKGEDWRDYAEDHLKPRPPKDMAGKSQGDRPPAFIERPDTSRR